MIYLHIHTGDAAAWKEEEHPRDPGGKWTEGGGTARKAPKPKRSHFKPAETHTEQQARKQADDDKFAKERLITDGPHEGFSRAGIIKGPSIGLWGASHYGSSMITGYSAIVMGIDGYQDLDAPAAYKSVGDTMLEAVRDSYGSSEKLYHGFDNSKKIEWKVGDTMRLPLTSTAGEMDTVGYGISYDREDNSGATLFEFPEGTRYAGYARWDRVETKEFGNTWAEAVIAGGFKVTGTRTEHEHGWKHLPYTVVTLEPTEYYDPYEDEWKAIDD